MELEVDTVLIFKKRIKLRLINGELTQGDLRVFECEEPYVLVFLIETQVHEELRMDIFKDDLARELRSWIEGKYIRHPAVLVPVRIDEAINKFVKFAKTPKQEDLVMWILSRCEVYPQSSSDHTTEIVFGGRSLEDSDARLVEWKEQSVNNPFAKTATIAAALATRDDSAYRGQANHSELMTTSVHTRGPETNQQLQKSKKTSTRNGMSKSLNFKHGDDMGMFEMTRQLLGTSQTLESLKSGRVQGRDGAKQVLKTTTWTSEHWRLCTEIEKARKDIERKMDERRRIMEVAKTRQMQSADRHRKIKESIKEAQGGNRFLADANQELMTLKKIEADIDDDILRQRNRVHRGAQTLAWTLAPAGFANRRGKSERGPVLGPGPLPPKATGSLKDPRVEMTLRRYYWDSAGRRHAIDLSTQEQYRAGEESLVSQAMEAIRRAAANITSFKLNLKEVFEDFDTSGDGFLSPTEMAQAFLKMGVKLDLPTMDAIFKHFDPDGSGSVHYGEFVWAFFNRRGLVRQWKRQTQGMTYKNILQKFHKADINGDGNLDPKEFARILQREFNMKLSPDHLEILIDRFDMDGDGDISLKEFLAFIESEQMSFGGAAEGGVVTAGPNASTLLPAPSQRRPIGRTDSPSVKNSESKVRSNTNHVPSSSSTSKSSAGQNAATSRPSSAPPRSRTGVRLNATAPGDLQRHHRQLNEDDDEENEEDLHPPRSALKGGRSAAASVVRATSPQEVEELYDDHRHAPADRARFAGQSKAGAEAPLEEGADVMWMARMLQAQAEIEARLGKRYYRNNEKIA